MSRFLKMANYFKSKYEKVAGYSPDWYGIMDYAPPATILLYDDNICECIGYMDSPLPEDVHITPLTEANALDIVQNYPEGEGIYFGEKLAQRWLSEENNLSEEDGING
jgi:hypothetical protein